MESGSTPATRHMTFNSGCSDGDPDVVVHLQMLRSTSKSMFFSIFPFGVIECVDLVVLASSLQSGLGGGYGRDRSFCVFESSGSAVS